MKTIALHLFLTLIVTTFAFGQTNNCLDFTGGYDRLDFPVPVGGTDNFTLEAWFKSDNNTGPLLARLFTWWGEGTRFEVGDRDGKLQIFEYDGSSHWVDTEVNIIDGHWHHVAITRENNVFKVYVDGELKNTHSRVLLMNNHLSVGHWNATLTQLSQWIGRIDEIRLWNIVRSQTDIQSTMNTELVGDEPGLATYLDFNQGVAGGDNTGLATAIDQTGNGFDGTLLDFSLNGNYSNWVCSSAFGASCDDCLYPGQACLAFDGQDDYLQVINSPIAGEVDFTVECWFLMEDYDGVAGCSGNMERIMAAGTDRYEIGVCSERLAVVVNSGSAVVLNSVENHTWYHVAGTREGNQFRFYLDGELIYSINIPTVLNNGFRIGRWAGSGAFDQVWAGKIDDMRVWNYARSQDEIISEKDCELTGSEDGLILYYNFNEGIPYEDNTNIALVPDLTQNGYDATFNGFDKIGNESNYVCSEVCPNEVSTGSDELENLLVNILTIFPVPVSKQLNIELETPAQVDIQFALYNLYGQNRGYFELLSGNTNHTVDLSHLPAGVYFLTYDHLGKIYSSKFVKQ